jgi:hypothetical protein
VGLQTLLSLTSTRRLCRLTNRHGWLGASWNPHTGIGLEVRVRGGDPLLSLEVRWAPAQSREELKGGHVRCR